MLKSVLLHLERQDQSEAVIRLGVACARACGARIRGITAFDAQWIAAAHQLESAASAAMAYDGRETAERQHAVACAALSRACAAAEVDFDVRQVSGDPLTMVSRESHFHDLTVASAPLNRGATVAAAMNLLVRGVEPLIVVQPAQQRVERVLLVYDGSESSSRAIRTFLAQGLFARADHRLLAVGPRAEAAEAALRDMAEYCRIRRPGLEAGFIAGRPRRVVPLYAGKWQADLLVYGVGAKSAWLAGLFGRAAARLWAQASCTLYLTR